jgi:hypothetical protein
VDVLDLVCCSVLILSWTEFLRICILVFVPDLWILSDSIWFGDLPQAKIMFAKSVWFGPSKDNVIELERLFGDPPLGAHIFAMVTLEPNSDSISAFCTE